MALRLVFFCLEIYGYFVQSAQITLEPTAATLLDAFQNHLDRAAFAPTTIRNYTADVRGFVRWLHLHRDGGAPDNLKTQDFEAFRSYLINETDQSGATVNRRLQALRVFGRFLYAEGLTSDNPAHTLQLVSAAQEDTPPRMLDGDEIAQLVVAVRAGASRRLMQRDYAIIELMLQAGLRVMEVAQLNLHDIVPTSNGLRLVIQGSAEHHFRQVPLNETLARALREYLQVRPTLPDVQAVFVSQQGRPLSTRSIQRLVEAYAAAAQLEDVNAYSLRHTCARKLLDEYPPEQVANWLGHKSAESLSKYK